MFERIRNVERVESQIHPWETERNRDKTRTALTDRRVWKSESKSLRNDACIERLEVLESETITSKSTEYKAKAE